MATTLQTLIDQARVYLLESAASYWTDAELLAIANKGIKDLWRAITDLNQDHHHTVDQTNVYQGADATQLSGVPSDVSTVRGIEPKDLASALVRYEKKDYMHPDFAEARAAGSVGVDTAGVIYYAITQAGGPVGAPTIYVAPAISTRLDLRLVYVPTIADKLLADANPIPGESDNALICWIVAWAHAKDNDGHTPDDAWLAKYATEKQNILVFLDPRSTQDDDVVEGVFESLW